MNKITATLLCLLSSVASLSAQNCKIQGTSNMEGSKVYLSIVDGGLKNVDSTLVTGNKFEMNVDIKKVDLYRVRIAKTWMDLSLCLEPNSHFSLEMNKVGEKKYKADFKVLKGREQNIMDSLTTVVADSKKEFEGDLVKQEMALAQVVEDAPDCFAKVVLADKVIYLEYNILEKVFKPLNSKYSYSHVYQSIKGKYEKENDKWLQGKQAQDFEIKGIDGKIYKLSDFRGSYVLLDFWASWCAPCRAKTKLLLEKKGEFDKAGLVLMAISMDDKENLWKAASEKDGITWLNLCELTGLTKSITAQGYKVTNLPTLFLINPLGKIIAQNPHLEEIVSLIKSDRK